MKIFFTLFVCFLSVSLSAQNPTDKKVGDFNEVKVYDLIKISLVKSQENKVTITGDDVEEVEAINKDGKLKIRMKFEKAFNGKKTFVAVHYTTLDIIDGNEGAIIIGNELIEQESIELRAQEGAVLKIGLDVKTVSIRAVTGGVIETRGKADSQDITINTGGIYEGRAFETKNTKVSIKAAGEADVKASEIVDAKIRAGGDINIYGNPKSIKEDRLLGGRIKRME